MQAAHCGSGGSGAVTTRVRCRGLDFGIAWGSLWPAALRVFARQITRTQNRNIGAAASLPQPSGDEKCGLVNYRRSNSSRVRGQSFLSSRESERSASSRPPVWQLTQ